MRKIIFFLIPCIFILSGFADSQQHVYQKAGNIYLRSESNDTPQKLTSLSQDSHPVLSPDSHWVAFLRKARFKIPKKCTAYYNPDDQFGFEVWIYDLSTRKEKLLVANNFDCDDPIKVIIDPSDLQFSPDSKILYFETSGWDTSGAIHSTNINGKNAKFVTAGNDYHVVTDGKYRGDLIINQHRYHDGGGSYDWLWLFTPSGKQIKLYRKWD